MLMGEGWKRRRRRCEVKLPVTRARHLPYGCASSPHLTASCPCSLCARAASASPAPTAREQEHVREPLRLIGGSSNPRAPWLCCVTVTPEHMPLFWGGGRGARLHRAWPVSHCTASPAGGSLFAFLTC